VETGQKMYINRADIESIKGSKNDNPRTKEQRCSDLIFLYKKATRRLRSIFLESYLFKVLTVFKTRWSSSLAYGEVATAGRRCHCIQLIERIRMVSWNGDRRKFMLQLNAKPCFLVHE